MQPFYPLRIRVALGALALAFLAHAQQAERPAAHGISIANMDPAVKPGDNFYLYANGGWLKRTVIPPDRSRIGISTTLSDLSNNRTRTLIEDAGKANAPAGSDTRKIADLYHSYMDEAGIESRGLAPIEPSLKAVADIHDKTQLAHALGESFTSRCGRAQQHQFSYSQFIWIVGCAGFFRFGSLRSLPAAGRA